MCFSCTGRTHPDGPCFGAGGRRGQALEVLAGLPWCMAAMEARGGAHFRGREIGKPGRAVKPLAPACVKPFVRRQKTDGEADRGWPAAAQAHERYRSHLRGFELAAQRSIDPGDRWKTTHQLPDRRFVAVKSEEKQGPRRCSACASG